MGLFLLPAFKWRASSSGLGEGYGRERDGRGLEEKVPVQSGEESLHHFPERRAPPEPKLRFGTCSFSS